MPIGETGCIFLELEAIKKRHFRTVSQSKRYDPEGTYIAKWNPSLAAIADHPESRWQPWDFVDSTGTHWATPIVDPKTQYTWQDLQLLEANGRIQEAAKESEDK